jgi:methylated-DNA-protein-cysteine methyltransferase-like protein
LTPFQLRIRDVVAALQPGEVVSYQEVARRAGSSRAPRAVGAFLAEFGDGLPWWRVVHKDGTLSAPNRRKQRARLIEEGVDVVDGRVVAPVP